jgi:hypothetical protein
MVSRSVLGLRAVVFGLVLLAPGLAPAQDSQTAQGPFRLEFREIDNTRGPVIEGQLYNGLAARIGNVRIRIDSVDGDGRVVGQSHGWVVGDAAAGGAAFFVVPLSVHGASYRATVESFDPIAPEIPHSNVSLPDSDVID